MAASGGAARTNHGLVDTLAAPVSEVANAAGTVVVAALGCKRWGPNVAVAEREFCEGGMRTPNMRRKQQSVLVVAAAAAAAVAAVVFRLFREWFGVAVVIAGAVVAPTGATAAAKRDAIMLGTWARTTGVPSSSRCVVPSCRSLLLEPAETASAGAVAAAAAAAAARSALFSRARCASLLRNAAVSSAAVASLAASSVAPPQRQGDAASAGAGGGASGSIKGVRYRVMLSSSSPLTGDEDLVAAESGESGGIL
jgi:hypothetical protein